MHDEKPLKRARANPWTEVIGELGLEDAVLVGRNHEARRVYRKDGEIWKVQLRIRDITADGVPWHGSLSGEFRIAQQCAGISRIPRAVRYLETNGYEAAVYTVCPGQRLRRLPPGVLLRMRMLWQLAAVLLRLSLRGVAHNDVRENNILVDRDSQSTRVHLIDFDRAIRTSRRSALFSNFLRIRRGAARSFHGSWIRLALWQLSPAASRVLQYCRDQLRRRRGEERSDH